MSGEISLKRLLTNMSPGLRDDYYVFCTIKDAVYGDFAEMKPFATVCEAEGLTLVLVKQVADQAGFEYESTFRCITLDVHSSLEAVGLTAAVSGALTEHQISANIIAGFFHDHIFVPSESANNALSLLLKLSE